MREPSESLRNVVFDMGGVLFKWEPMTYARRVVDSEEDAELLAREVFESREWALGDAGVVSTETIAWAAKQRLPERLGEKVDELIFHWFDRRTVIEGTAELIADLKRQGFGVYLLSNAGETFEQYKVDLPSYELFDGMVVSYRERLMKPDPAIYGLLLGRFGLVAKESIFIDDTPLNVEGARRVGMQARHFDGDVASLRAYLLG